MKVESSKSKRDGTVESHFSQKEARSGLTLPDHLVCVAFIVDRHSVSPVQGLYLENCSLTSGKHTLAKFLAENVRDEKPLPVDSVLGKGKIVLRKGDRPSLWRGIQ